MKTFLLITSILAAINASDARLLLRHHGHGMMNDGDLTMMEGEDMMMGKGHHDGMDGAMMQGCHEMMESGGMMGMMDGDEFVGHCPMSVIHKLVNNRHDITRHIKDTSKGVLTKTHSKSDSTKTNSWIREHVDSMMKLVASGHRIRNWDGLFKELFDHASEMKLECHDDDETGGVQCKFKASSTCAVGLSQAHARVVSAFVENGWDEVHQDHSEMVPDSCLKASN